MDDQPTNKYRKQNMCPYCGYFCDAATLIGEDAALAPEPGNLSFCLECAEASEFSANMTLIKFDLGTIKNKTEKSRLMNLQKDMKNFLKIYPRQ